MKNEVATINTEISEELMAQSIAQQYDDITKSADALVRKIVNFGCALAQAEVELTSRGLCRAGSGMAGWLAKNCPNVNYKTAMRWKSVGMGVSRSLKCTASEALQILDGDADDLTTQQMKRRDDILAADSVRKLASVIFDFNSEDHGTAGRPAGSAAKVVKLTKIESARRLWAGVLSTIARNREGLYKAATLLPIDEARAGLDEINALASSLVRRCKEGK